MESILFYWNYFTMGIFAEKIFSADKFVRIMSRFIALTS